MSRSSKYIEKLFKEKCKREGFTPEEIADRCVDKLMYVSEDAPPAIKDQAKAFKDRMRVVVAFYMQDAIKNDRVTMYNQLAQAGHSELADIIRRL